MARGKESVKFLHKKKRERESKNCFVQWWNQEFTHQESLCRIIEKRQFRFLVIFLVVADTALVISEIMLDSYKIQYECEHQSQHHPLTKSEEKEKVEQIDTVMEVAHFTSIGILVFFAIELVIRIYASGKEFFNIRRKKMEYFDAFIVLTSLAIDLYFLRAEKHLLGSQLLLLFSFRLWRFVRIISSVAEGVRHGQIKHKVYLNQQYIIAINRLGEVLKHKTKQLETHQDDVQAVLEHFQMIDRCCESSLTELNENHILTSTDIITQFIADINGVENRTNESVAELLMIKPTAAIV